VMAKVRKWTTLRTRASSVPRLLFLDNGYASLASTQEGSRPLEAMHRWEPLGGAGNASGVARQSAALAFAAAADEIACDNEAGEVPRSRTCSRSRTRARRLRPGPCRRAGSGCAGRARSRRRRCGDGSRGWGW
jgi:hypothetical protein